MKTVYKHIMFEQDGPDDHERWFCRNKKSDYELGEVTYYRKWKQWVIDFRDGCIFNSTCLNDIAHFLGQLNTKKSPREGT